MYPMYRKTLIASAVALMAAGLVACGGSDNDDDDNGPGPGPQPEEVGEVVALTADGRLFSFDRADPSTEVGSVQVSGLASGETLVGMDVRPADGLLYGVTRTGVVYRIDPSTGVATSAGTLTAATQDSTSPYSAPLSGDNFGVDWNPAADALRIVSNTGQNLRIFPTARTVGTTPEVAWATLTDGALTLNGAPAAGVTGAGYINSFDAATGTALYVLNSDDNNVYQQDANAGTLMSPGSPLGVDFDAVNGFDVDAESNLGYAALTVGGSTQLYSLPVGAVTGVAEAEGTIGDGSDPIVGLALNTPAAPTVLALTTDNRLFSFNPRTPNTASAPVAISGLGATETVVGIDVRPLDGMLYAVTRDTTNGNGSVYSVDATSGAATPAYDLVQVGTTTPVTLADAVYSVDFNPAADALRIINDDGLNLRVFPSARDVMGTPRVAGDTVTDTPLTRASGAPVVVASAYTNSRVSATRPAGTMLFNLETNSDVLTQQDANAGVLTDIGTELGTGIDAGTMAGFDIGGERNGLVLAAFGGATGPYRLYTVNLTTGAAALPRGLTNDTALIGGAMGLQLRDIAIRF